MSGTGHEQLIHQYFDALTNALLSTRSGTFKLSTARTVLRRLLTDAGHLSVRLTPQDTQTLQGMLDQHKAFRRLSDEPEWERVRGARKIAPLRQKPADAA